MVEKNYYMEYSKHLFYFSDEEKKTIIDTCTSIDSKSEISSYHKVVKMIQEEYRKKDKNHSDLYMNSYINQFEKTEEIRKRIYRILHFIFINLEKLGYSVKYEDGIKAIILNTEVEFRIREKGKIVYVEDNSFLSYNGKRRELKPTGVLELSIFNGYDAKRRLWIHSLKSVWTDGKKEKLEDIIGKFIIELLYTATKIITDEEERKEKEREYELIQKLKRERLEKKKKELEKLDSLEQMAVNYERAIRIRNFIHDYSQKKNLTEEDKKFIEWANNKADWLDPMIKRKDPILDDEIEK